MPTIFVPIEVSEEEVARLSLASQGMVTGSNPPSSQPPQSAEAPASQSEADPWETATPTPPVQTGVSQTPRCAHGEMRYVPAGVSQRTNRAYKAFWACDTPQGTPNKCKSVPA